MKWQNVCSIICLVYAAISLLFNSLSNEAVFFGLIIVALQINLKK